MKNGTLRVKFKFNILRDKSRLIKGESLVETLAAMMIVVMAFTILAGALAASAKINDKISEATNTEVSFDSDTTQSFNITLDMSDDTSEHGETVVKKMSNIPLTTNYYIAGSNGIKYYYYRKND